MSSSNEYVFEKNNYITKIFEIFRFMTLISVKQIMTMTVFLGIE